MIRLFVSDIDGCLSMPYESFRLDRLGELANFAREAGLPGSRVDLPAVSICSGRSYAYVEAMAQVLALNTPTLFEAGAGMFDPVSAHSSWHPNFTKEIQERISDIRRFMEEVVASKPGLFIDYGKRSQAALAGGSHADLMSALALISEWVASNHPGYHTFHTHISIDVVADGLTKAEGLYWLAETCGVDMDEIAFVGDTNGDVGAMAVCGRSFAPANSDEKAKAAADHVSSLSDIDAVLEAYTIVRDGPEAE